MDFSLNGGTPLSEQERKAIGSLPEPVPSGTLDVTDEHVKTARALVGRYTPKRPKVEDGGFVVSSVEFPGVRGWGVNEQAARTAWQDSLVLVLSELVACGGEAPEPGKAPTASVSRALRLPAQLDAMYTEYSRRNGISFSELVRQALQEFVANHADASTAHPTSP